MAFLPPNYPNPNQTPQHIADVLQADLVIFLTTLQQFGATFPNEPFECTLASPFDDNRYIVQYDPKYPLQPSVTIAYT